MNRQVRGLVALGDEACRGEIQNKLLHLSLLLVNLFAYR
jgi:hypothetical protein